MKIKTLSIRNFKAFGPEQRFDFDGKNILIYGNNGSGKSSVYYALHVLMQSSVIGKNWQKYFDETNDENLLNRYINPGEFPPFISLTLDDAGNSRYELNPDSDLLRGQPANDVGVPTMRLANLASDFMNYRLLSSFYSFRNSENANVWPIFEKEILPYWLIDATNPRSPTFEDQLDSLKERLRELGIRRGPERRSGRMGNKYSELKNDIDKFNNRFADEYRKLEPAIEPLLRHFLPEGDLFELVLEPETILKIDDQDPYRWVQSVIKLTLTSTNTRVPIIPKPQSFMNEARLTALALAIRLAMVGDKFKGPAGSDVLQVSVIDDLLISLDMSNRMKVIKYLQTNPDFRNYQLIILTHDKGFFEILKTNLANDSANWKWLEMYEQHTTVDTYGNYQNPVCIEAVDSLKKAECYLNGTRPAPDAQPYQKDYEACALYLRKHTEELLRVFFDPTLEELTRYDVFKYLATTLNNVPKEVNQKLVEGFVKVFNNTGMNETKIQRFRNRALNLPITATMSDEEKAETIFLNDYKAHVFNYVLEYYTHEKIVADSLIERAGKLNEIRGRILNAGAHAGNEPLYRQELEAALSEINEFKSDLSKLKYP